MCLKAFLSPDALLHKNTRCPLCAVHSSQYMWATWWGGLFTSLPAFDILASLDTFPNYHRFLSWWCNEFCLCHGLVLCWFFNQYSFVAGEFGVVCSTQTTHFASMNFFLPHSLPCTIFISLIGDGCSAAYTYCLPFEEEHGLLLLCLLTWQGTPSWIVLLYQYHVDLVRVVEVHVEQCYYLVESHGNWLSMIKRPKS